LYYFKQIYDIKLDFARNGGPGRGKVAISAKSPEPFCIMPTVAWQQYHEYLHK